jgi:hypothetical protein
MPITPNHWYKIKGQSLAIYARNAGFDLAMHDKYTPTVRSELRRRSVIEALKSIELACKEQGLDLSRVKRGVYVIALSSPLSILYPNSKESQTIYIGRGNIRGRIEAHFKHKLFDLMLSLAGADFDFYFAKPTRSGTKDYFKQVEHGMIEFFQEKHGRALPILNKISGQDQQYVLNGIWWKTPLNRNGKKPLWAIKPTKFNDFKLE